MSWWLALLRTLLFVGLAIWGLTGLLPGGKRRLSVRWIRKIRGPIRVANAWAPLLTDYVNRAGLVAIRLGVAVVAGACLLAGLLLPWEGAGFGRHESGPMWLTAVVAVGCLATAEIVARRLVDRPLPSGDPLALYWRESLRAEQVQRVFRLPVFLGFLAPVLMASGSVPYGTSTAQHLTALIVYALGGLGPLLFLPASQLLLRRPQTPHRRATLAAARHAYVSV